MSKKEYAKLNHEGFKAYLANQIGESLGDRHVIVNSENKVVHILGFDPAIDMVNGKHRNKELQDKFGGHRVIRHDHAHIGHLISKEG